MAPKSKTVLQGIKDYPKERLKMPTLGGSKLDVPNFGISDYSAGSPLRLTGTEGPLVLKVPKLKKPKLPRK